MKLIFKQWVNSMFAKLGYVDRLSFDRLRDELSQSNRRLDRYVQFASSAYQYAGTYPNWKALQEFRQIVRERPIGHYIQDPSPLDAYLSKLVDETKTLLEEESKERLSQNASPSVSSSVANTSTYFDKSFLDSARGEPFVST